jgi:hypothetical protein
VLGPRELPTVAIAIAQRVNEQVRSVMIGMGERTTAQPPLYSAITGNGYGMTPRQPVHRPLPTHHHGVSSPSSMIKEARWKPPPTHMCEMRG